MKTLATVMLAICVLGASLSSQTASSSVLRAPTALPPSDPTVLRTSGYTGETAAGQTQWIRSSAPLSTAADDARKRLTALGWRVVFTQTASAISITRFAADAVSEPRVGILTVTTVAPGQIVVSVRLLRRGPADPTPESGRMGGGGASQTEALPLQVAITQLLTGFPAPSPADPGFARLAAVPPDFPPRLVPGGFKVNTVLTSASRTTIVGTIDNSNATELAPFLTAIRQTGWTERTLAGGFYTSIVSAAFCEGTRVVDMGLLDRPDRVTIVAISVNTTGRCMPSGTDNTARFSIPLLRVLPEWDPEDRSGSGNAAQRRSQLRLTTALTPAELWNHFESQMKAAGFGVDARVGDAGQLVARFSTTADAGTPATAVLAFTVLPGSKKIDAYLEVFRTEGR